jgi:hypothetical protein
MTCPPISGGGGNDAAIRGTRTPDVSSLQRFVAALLSAPALLAVSCGGDEPKGGPEPAFDAVQRIGLPPDATSYAADPMERGEYAVAIVAAGSSGRGRTCGRSRSAATSPDPL